MNKELVKSELPRKYERLESIAKLIDGQLVTHSDYVVTKDRMFKSTSLLAFALQRAASSITDPQALSKVFLIKGIISKTSPKAVSFFLQNVKPECLLACTERGLRELFFDLNVPPNQSIFEGIAHRLYHHKNMTKRMKECILEHLVKLTFYYSGDMRKAIDAGQRLDPEYVPNTGCFQKCLRFAQQNSNYAKRYYGMWLKGSSEREWVYIHTNKDRIFMVPKGTPVMLIYSLLARHYYTTFHMYALYHGDTPLDVNELVDCLDGKTISLETGHAKLIAPMRQFGISLVPLG